MAGFNLGGATGGALTGAGAGSAFGPWGTVAGGILGALGGGFGGGSAQSSTKSVFDKNQRKLNQELYEGLEGRGPYANLFTFDPTRSTEYYQQSFVNPAMQQFERSLAPKIMGQFRGGNLGQSSYAGQAIGQAASDVQRDLNSQLARLLYEGENAAINRRLNTVQNLLGQSTQAYQPAPDNPMMELFKSLGPAAMQALARQYGPQPQQYSPGR